MAELVGKRYASSLFEVGLELDKVDEFYKQIEFMKEIFRSEAKLLSILEHPRISRIEKQELVNKIFEKNLSEEIRNFLFILIDKRREDSIMDIIEEYKKLYKEHKNILEIEAVTAVPMKESLQDRLKIKLKEKFNKEIHLFNSVDDSLIGGVLLKMDEKIIDSTLQGKLKEMEFLIKGVSL